MDNNTVTFEQNDSNAYPNQGVYYTPKKKSRALPIILIVIAALMVLYGIYLAVQSKDNNEGFGFKNEYVAVLDVIGEISGSAGTYNHSWMIQTIEDLKNDDNNKAIFLRVDSPGGSVYTSDELYLKLKEYQETTKRPVYAYYGSISAGADKIIANRNCWTGSIGVTLGTMYDFTGLMEKYGIKAETITSGSNKSMGSSFEEMSDEQRSIFQSLVDEAYDQFVGIVADGRKMTVAQVKKYADGRILTANQALKAGLIDGVADEESAMDELKNALNNTEINFEYLEPDPVPGNIYDLFMESQSNSTLSELNALAELIKNGNVFQVSYKANITR